MTMTTAAVATPNYMLKDEKRPLGPTCVPLRSGTECSAVYGFSGKMPYDNFLSNSSQPLTPYPMVNVFLRDQAELTDAGLRLIVLDASGTDAESLYAATRGAVRTARETQTTMVMPTHRLTFNPQAGAYQVEEVSE